MLWRYYRVVLGEHMAKKALVVIDMQNDFISGVLGSENAKATVPVVLEKIKEYNSNELPVIATKDTHPKSYLEDIEGDRVPRHCIRGERGSELDDALLSCHFLKIIEKNNFMASPEEQNKIKRALYEFFGSDPDELEVCGLCADICVVSNALMLRMLFPNAIIKVDRRATAGTTKENEEAAFAVMRSCLIDII